MKRTSLLAIAALTLSGVAATVAQTQSQVETQTQVQTQSAPAAGTAQTPAPIVIETKVDLTSEPGPPADLRAAREEAVNALHWAKTEGCRNDAAPRECIRRAQDEYQSAMSRLGGATGMSRN
jgi:hypothetical protein